MLELALLAAVGPLVFRKAVGRTAGLVAVAVALGTVAAVLLLGAGGVLRGTCPVMVVLGPLLVAQHAVWGRRRGGERTTWRYLREEPPAPVAGGRGSPVAVARRPR